MINQEKDYYRKGVWGPVPQYANNLLSGLSPFESEEDKNNIELYFQLEDRYIKAKTSYNEDFISESERECMDKSIVENQNKEIYHFQDQAYEKPRIFNQIDFVQMAKSAGANEEKIKHIEEHLDIRNFFDFD